MQRCFCALGSRPCIRAPTPQLGVTAAAAARTAMPRRRARRSNPGARTAAPAGSVIAVSHDRYFLKRIATRIVEVEGGKLLDYKGDYEVRRPAGQLGGQAAGLLPSLPTLPSWAALWAD